MIRRIPTQRKLAHRLLTAMGDVIARHPLLTGLAAAVLVSALNS